LQPDNQAVVVFDNTTMSIYHWLWPLTGVAPWTTEPGKQLVGTHMAYSAEDAAAAGGPDAIYAGLLERTEEIVPGFKTAVIDSVSHQSVSGASAWTSPTTIGPKIPRRVDSVGGLWFVGDGSEGCRGLFSEAAASCGILGARAISEKG